MPAAGLQHGHFGYALLQTLHTSHELFFGEQSSGWGGGESLLQISGTQVRDPVLHRLAPLQTLSAEAKLHCSAKRHASINRIIAAGKLRLSHIIAASSKRGKSAPPRLTYDQVQAI